MSHYNTYVNATVVKFQRVILLLHSPLQRYVLHNTTCLLHNSAPYCTTQDSIHRVLQGLAVRMNRAKRLYQKSQLFCGYFVFVDLLCQEMSSGLNSTAKFVIYFSLHTTLNFLQGLSEKDGQLIAIGCDVLLSLCRHSDPYQVVS